MRDQDVFDACHAKYAQMRGAGLRAVRMERVEARRSGRQTLPGPREFMLDFQLAGRRALVRRRGRLRAFWLYYCDGMAYEDVRALVRVKHGTLEWWLAQIRRDVGGRLRAAGVWPVRRYFGEPAD